jgi:hypothetical protein
MYAEPCIKQQELYDSGEVPGAGGKPYGEVKITATAPEAPRLGVAVSDNQPTRTYINDAFEHNYDSDGNDLDI